MTIILPDLIMGAAVILGISGAALVAAKSAEFRRAGFSQVGYLENKSTGIWDNVKRSDI